MKRLAASVVVTGRANGFSDKANLWLAIATTEAYTGQDLGNIEVAAIRSRVGYIRCLSPKGS